MRWRGIWLVVAGVVLWGARWDANACNVPAFRYALERWPADPYQILVYSRGAPEGQAFQMLQKAAGRSGTANCSLRRVDVSRPEGQALAEQHKVTSLPWIEIYYPIHFQHRTPIWAGALSPDNVRTILDSPGRAALAKDLLGGDVAVWVLLTSGDEGEDARARQTLKSNLDRAAASLRIPEIGTDLNGNPVDVKDFKSYPVRFSLIEVARGDARESLLVNALLKSEPDLSDEGAPIAFPIFGRGRALYALVGRGIQEKTVLDACGSMLGWCSCEIKALNPGTDLLVSADWSRPFGGKLVNTPELPNLAGLDSFRPAPKAAETRPGTTLPAPVSPAPAASCAAPVPRLETRDTTPARDPLIRNLLYLAATGGFGLAVFSVVVKVRANRSTQRREDRSSRR
jgi:hypothetical protein